MERPLSLPTHPRASRRTRCPRVGVSLECDVPSWHPSAPEESSRARRNLRQLFLHPRTANEEPDRMVKPEFWFMPLPSSMPRLPGAKWSGGFLVRRYVIKRNTKSSFKSYPCITNQILVRTNEGTFLLPYASKVTRPLYYLMWLKFGFTLIIYNT